MNREVFIGIDGGGTYTRGIAIDCSGRILSSAITGGSNPEHNADAAVNAIEAINTVIKRANCACEDVAGLVAGFAGLNSDDDQSWATRQTAVHNLHCARWHVNDAVVAHEGALRSESGIVAISGTGSTVLGVTTGGQRIFSSSLHYRATSYAGYIARNAIHQVLVGDIDPTDHDFVEKLLTYYKARDTDNLLRNLFEAAPNGKLSDYQIEHLAPVVTECAESGSRTAQLVCEQAVESILVGIRLVGNLMGAEKIKVALIGGVMKSTYIQTAIRRTLSTCTNPRFIMVKPAFSPEKGAALLALKSCGVQITEQVLNNLGQIGPMDSSNLPS